MARFTVPTLRRCRGIAASRRARMTYSTEEARTHEAKALQALRSTGVTILAQRNNGRRMVVEVDTPPAFVRGGMCRRQLNAEGVPIYTLAAPWRGLQLEWNQQPQPEVCHG